VAQRGAELESRVSELQDELFDAVAGGGGGDDEDDDDDDEVDDALVARLGIKSQLEEMEDELVDAVVHAERAQALSEENAVLKRRLELADAGAAGSAVPWVVPDLETEERLASENAALLARINELTEAAASAEEEAADAGLMSHLSGKRAAALEAENAELVSLLAHCALDLDCITAQHSANPSPVCKRTPLAYTPPRAMHRPATSTILIIVHADALFILNLFILHCFLLRSVRTCNL